MTTNATAAGPVQHLGSLRYHTIYVIIPEQIPLYVLGRSVEEEKNKHVAGVALTLRRFTHNMSCFASVVRNMRRAKSTL